MTDFRALCVELLDALQGYVEYAPVLDEGVEDERRLVIKARTALAQPEPVEPTDEEIMDLMPRQMHDDLAAAARGMAGQAGTDNRNVTGMMRIILNRHAVDYTRIVLAKWGCQ